MAHPGDMKCNFNNQICEDITPKYLEMMSISSQLSNLSSHKHNAANLRSLQLTVMKYTTAQWLRSAI
jgi:hypothetical protein